MPCGPCGYRTSLAAHTIVGAVTAATLGAAGWADYPGDLWEELFRVGATVEPVGDVLMFTPDASTDDPRFGARTRFLVDLENVPLFLNVEPPPGASGTPRARLSLGSGPSDPPFASVDVQGGVITYDVEWGNGAVGTAVEPYNPRDPGWWRLRYDRVAGDIVIDAAACGTWSERLRVNVTGAEVEPWEDWCVFQGTRWIHVVNYPTPAALPDDVDVVATCDDSLSIDWTSPVPVSEGQRQVRFATVSGQGPDIVGRQLTIPVVPMSSENHRVLIGLFTADGSADEQLEAYVSLRRQLSGAYTLEADVLYFGTGFAFEDHSEAYSGGALELRWRYAGGDLTISVDDGSGFRDIVTATVPVDALDGLALDIQGTVPSLADGPNTVTAPMVVGVITLADIDAQPLEAVAPMNRVHVGMQSYRSPTGSVMAGPGYFGPINQSTAFRSSVAALTLIGTTIDPADAWSPRVSLQTRLGVNPPCP